MSDPISARLIASFILSIVYLYLYWVQREKYLGVWGLAWLFFFNSYVMRLVPGFDSVLYYDVLFEFNTLLTTYLQLLGGYLISNRSVSRIWYVLFAVTAVWLVIAYSASWNLFGAPFGTSSNFLYAFGTMYAGFLIINGEETWGKEKVVVGINLFMLGIINTIYPWTSESNTWDYYQLEGHSVLFFQISLAVSILIMYFRSSEHKLQLLHKEHELALAKIIRGYLPICAHCKSIRESDDTWVKLESYVSRHSDAQLSHGICPVCLLEHYPDFKGK